MDLTAECNEGPPYCGMSYLTSNRMGERQVQMIFLVYLPSAFRRVVSLCSTEYFAR